MIITEVKIPDVHGCEVTIRFAPGDDYPIKINDVDSTITMSIEQFEDMVKHKDLILQYAEGE